MKACLNLNALENLRVYKSGETGSRQLQLDVGMRMDKC